jgi:hypothetical protein
VEIVKTLFPHIPEEHPPTEKRARERIKSGIRVRFRFHPENIDPVVIAAPASLNAFFPTHTQSTEHKGFLFRFSFAKFVFYLSCVLK